MDALTKAKVSSTMQIMALNDEDFRVIYDFFNELGTVDKKGFVIVCRAKMPFVADRMIKVMPNAIDSPIVQHMKGVHHLRDEEVIQLSAAFLKNVLNSVQAAIESR
jgi:hypothetical protein